MFFPEVKALHRIPMSIFKIELLHGIIEKKPVVYIRRLKKCIVGPRMQWLPEDVHGNSFHIWKCYFFWINYPINILNKRYIIVFFIELILMLLFLYLLVFWLTDFDIDTNITTWVTKTTKFYFNLFSSQKNASAQTKIIWLD